MVVNAPTSNIVSAAELAVGADARRGPPHQPGARRADATASGSARKYTGIELYEKTVGIVGLGRIGVLVAQRLSGFGMNVIAYDPYVQAGRAAQMGVRLVEPRRAARRGRLHQRPPAQDAGDRRADRRRRSSRKAKPALVLVNAARGGIVDEEALYDALKTGRIAAAGLDVFAKEPCTDTRCSSSRTSSPPRTSAPPPTRPRRRPASRSPGRCGSRCPASWCPTRSTCRAASSPRTSGPASRSTEKLGRIFTALAGEVAQQLDVEVRGEITEYDVKVLELAALKGVFADIVEDQVSYVNAPLLAAERGIAVRLVTEAESPDHRNLITIRGTLADGSQVSVSGTLIGIAQKERLVEVNGFDVDLEPTEHLAFFTYEDRPGMVGIVGQILGDAGVNIAGMQVSRDEQGRHGPGGAHRSTPRSRPRCWTRSARRSTPTRCGASTSASERSGQATTGVRLTSAPCRRAVAGGRAAQARARRRTASVITAGGWVCGSRSQCSSPPSAANAGPEAR